MTLSRFHHGLRILGFERRGLVPLLLGLLRSAQCAELGVVLPLVALPSRSIGLKELHLVAQIRALDAELGNLVGQAPADAALAPQ
eukprot:5468528-Pleurochrysis_carterae.AAC.1